MGAFDQFRDQAEDFADKAKSAVADKRNKSAGSENAERMDRGMRQDGQRRRPRGEDEPRERMGSEPDEQDNWT
jgi:hypothetical protein